MPHITLEYTDNIDQPIEFDDLFAELHQLLVDVAGIHIDNSKSRALRLDTYSIGKGEEENAFVHLGIWLLEGRSAELKQEIGKQGLEVLRDHFAQSLAEHKLQITLEIRDMQREAYFKTVSE